MASQQSLRKALGAIKDSTKVGLAKVNSTYKVGRCVAFGFFFWWQCVCGAGVRLAEGDVRLRGIVGI